MLLQKKFLNQSEKYFFTFHLKSVKIIYQKNSEQFLVQLGVQSIWNLS